MEYKTISLNEFRQGIAGEKSFIWLLNIEAEKLWHPLVEAIKNDDHRFLAQTEYINLLLCRKQDYLIVHQIPDHAFLDYLQKLGCEIPTFLVPEAMTDIESISEKVLKDGKLMAFLKKLKYEAVFFPYAVTSLEELISKKTGIKLMSSNSKAAQMVNSKVFARQLSLELGLPVCEGEICNNPQQALEYYKKHFIGEKCVLKNAYGASGKGLYIVDDVKQLQRIVSRSKTLGLDSTCIIEKWYDEKVDLNYQLYISETGDILSFSIKEQIMAGTKYVGSVIPPRLAPLNDYYEIVKAIGNKLYQKGYWGGVSIDAIFTNGQFIPIVEINGRFSLSTYFSFFQDTFHYSKAVSKYYDVYSDPISFETNLYRAISTSVFGAKVVIYNYCLNSQDKFHTNYKYRLFLLYLGDSYTQIFLTMQQIENIIKNLTDKEQETKV